MGSTKAIIFNVSELWSRDLKKERGPLARNAPRVEGGHAGLGRGYMMRPYAKDSWTWAESPFLESKVSDCVCT